MEKHLPVAHDGKAKMRELSYLTMCRELAARPGLKPWEATFVANMVGLLEKGGALTGAQRTKLAEIYEERP